MLISSLQGVFILLAFTCTQHGRSCGHASRQVNVPSPTTTCTWKILSRPRQIYKVKYRALVSIRTLLLNTFIHPTPCIPEVSLWWWWSCAKFSTWILCWSLKCAVKTSYIRLKIENCFMYIYLSNLLYCHTFLFINYLISDCNLSIFRAKYIPLPYMREIYVSVWVL
jgi:hypothetical protein